MARHLNKDATLLGMPVNKKNGVKYSLNAYFSDLCKFLEEGRVTRFLLRRGAVHGSVELWCYIAVQCRVQYSTDNAMQNPTKAIPYIRLHSSSTVRSTSKQ